MCAIFLIICNLPLCSPNQSGITALRATMINNSNKADSPEDMAMNKAAIFLIRNGANTSEKCENGESVLHLAASHRNYPVAKCLVDAGVDVNIIRNWDRSTPLHVAARCNSMTICVELIDACASRELKNNNTMTPLEMCEHALKHGQWTSVQMIELLKTYTPRSDEFKDIVGAL